MKPLAPNTLLQNRYLIVHLIGKGGMGEVYLAVDQRLGSAVALKRTYFSDDEMLGNAFEREARTLARLRHPVLPKVSDHFTENELQYLVMEHITGDDLSKRLEITNKPFPLNWVLFWADQLLDGLAYLHGHEPPIVHRDIKPQNLKLTDENHIVLLDFGLAKNSIGSTKVSSTTGGSIVGYTPHYAPMEQIRGTGTNPRSDIYSFAATFYQLMTNIVPPDAITRADSVLNGLPDPTKSITDVNPEIPKSISDIIMKGMALSMEQRYMNARDMQKALREAYNEMQTAMSAQTMAFNVPAQQSQSVPQSQQQTEQFSGDIMNHIPAENPHQAPTLVSNSSIADKTENLPSSMPQGISEPPNFDATLKYDAQPFGIKTEVLPREKMPSADAYKSNVPQDDFQDNFSGNSFSSNDSFSSANSFNSKSEEKINFEDSIPSIVNFGEEKAAPAPVRSEFDSIPRVEEPVPVVDRYEPVENERQPEVAHAVAATATPVSKSTEKKSGGKGLLIVGGLLALLIFAGGALGIGWYVYKSSTAANPTPTPKVETTPTPVLDATPESTVEASTTPVTTPTEVVSSTPETKPSETPLGTNDPKTTVTPEKTPSTQQVQPTPVKATPTPRVGATKTPVTTPPKTPPPVKTPVKSNPTDILQ